jgi:hypothetical protein
VLRPAPDGYLERGITSYWVPSTGRSPFTKTELESEAPAYWRVMGSSRLTSFSPMLVARAGELIEPLRYPLVAEAMSQRPVQSLNSRRVSVILIPYGYPRLRASGAFVASPAPPKQEPTKRSVHGRI